MKSTILYGIKIVAIVSMSLGLGYIFGYDDGTNSRTLTLFTPSAQLHVDQGDNPLLACQYITEFKGKTYNGMLCWTMEEFFDKNGFPRGEEESL